jgi:hypothetical protein
MKNILISPSANCILNVRILFKIEIEPPGINQTKQLEKVSKKIPLGKPEGFLVF